MIFSSLLRFLTQRTTGGVKPCYRSSAAHSDSVGAQTFRMPDRKRFPGAPLSPRSTEDTRRRRRSGDQERVRNGGWSMSVSRSDCILIMFVLHFLPRSPRRCPNTRCWKLLKFPQCSQLLPGSVRTNFEHQRFSASVAATQGAVLQTRSIGLRRRRYGCNARGSPKLRFAAASQNTARPGTGTSPACSALMTN